MVIDDKQDRPTRITGSSGNDTGESLPHQLGRYEGMVLDGRYLIEREIGRGGLGVVYLAHDQQLLGRRVVIKVLLGGWDQAATEEWSRRKFRQEIEALARIDHPGVVGVLQAGQMPGGRPYLVMQYVEGVTLRSVLPPRGMPFSRTASVLQQLGHALSAAHDRGIFHRDLKPENIMLQSVFEGEEYVKLIDFGIATVKDSRETPDRLTTAIAGTTAYMAPEQLLGRPTAASDIYAMGVIAYEVVTGRWPFNPDSPFELIELQRAGVRIRPADLRPSLPEAAQALIISALSYDQEQRPSSARDFGDRLAHALTSVTGGMTTAERLPPATSPNTLASRAVTAAQMPTVVSAGGPVALRIALLYKRNIEADRHVLDLIEATLTAQGYDVFVDRNLTIGVEWAKEIERQVRTADAIIPILSPASVVSEMIAFEVQIAHEAAQHGGKPRILPIRVDYDGPLPDPIGSILDPIQYASWQGPADDEALAAEILASLRAPEAELIKTVEPPGGAVPLDSKFYLVRPTDGQFLEAIKRHDSIVLIKGARQMGKTSLLARGLQQARQEGSKVVITDLQKLNAANLETIEAFFLGLGELLANQLDLDVYPEDVWKARRAPSINFERYVRREILDKVPTPLVWGIDEVDRLFTCSYGSEVFGLLRSWHNERAVDPAGPWHRLTMAIVYATEAHLFITDQNQSPFNVGTRLELNDFTLEQVAQMNDRYGSPLKSAADLERYFRLVGGHPYLVHRGLHEMVSTGTTLEAFEELADRDEGPFGDHLRRILVLLARDAALGEVVRNVLRGQDSSSPEDFYRLRSAGIMVGDSAPEMRPRCRLYTTYLERHFL